LPRNSPHPAWGALRTVFREPRLVRSLFSYLLFNTADLATWVALLVFAYDRGGVTAAATIAAVQLLPPALVSPFGALIGDRLRRSRALAVGYVLQAATLSIAATALWADVPMSLIYLIAAADAIAASLTRPVYLAALPTYVNRPRELVAANSVSKMIEEGGIFVGPAIAALILSKSDPWAVYAVFALGQLLAAALVFRRTSARTAKPGSEKREPLRLRAAFAGLRELRRTRGAALMLGYIAVAWFVAGGVELLAVVLAVDVLRAGDAAAGFLFSAAGIGGLIGATASVLLAGRNRLAPVVAGSMILAGVSVALTGMSPGLLVAGLLYLIAATGRSFLDVAAWTLLQQRVRPQVMARVFGLQEGLIYGAQAGGMIFVPALIALFGTTWAFAALGSLLPVACLFTWRRLHRLDMITAPAPGLALLRDNPIFSVLPPPDLEGLARCLQPLTARAGEIVIRQGQLGDRFYLIEEGHVDVTVDGIPRPSRGPGAFFGEIALLRNAPRSATVTAATPVKLQVLNRDAFLRAVTGSSRAEQYADEVADRRLAAARPRRPGDPY